MTTLSDQRLSPQAWYTVTGLTLATSYLLQNKSSSDVLVVEDSSPPAKLTEGRRIAPGDTYSFTKAADNVYVCAGQQGGYIAINETA